MDEMAVVATKEYRSIVFQEPRFVEYFRSVGFNYIQYSYKPNTLHLHKHDVDLFQSVLKDPNLYTQKSVLKARLPNVNLLFGSLENLNICSFLQILFN